MESSIASAIVDDEDALQEINTSIMKDEMQHPETTEETRPQHIQDMIREGLTDQQMLDLHQEITQQDIETVKQEMLDSNNE